VGIPSAKRYTKAAPHMGSGLTEKSMVLEKSKEGQALNALRT